MQDAQDSLQAIFPFTSVVDGPGGVIPNRVSVLMNSGKFSRIPFMAGADLDDGEIWRS